MKEFIATIEERYVWKCPYCKELCDSDCEDPEHEDYVECEHCGKMSKCTYTERQA